MLYVRPIAVLTVGGLLLTPGPWRVEGLRSPMILLALFALTIAIQLVPLPPAAWMALPGHAPYRDAAIAAGTAQPWRPISLVPDRTIASLLSLLPAAGSLLVLAGVPRRYWPRLVEAVLAVVVLSALFGIVQIATGALYTYYPTSLGLPVGLFANRNHQAVLLDMGVVLLAWWATRPVETKAAANWRRAIALAIVVILVTLVLLTGSRTGLLLLVVALVPALLVTLAEIRARGIDRRWTIPALIAPAAMLVVGALTAQQSGYARLSAGVGQLGEDMRALALPTVMEMIRTYLPWGCGFGTFDRAFYQFEPDALLKRSTFNNAHSDPLELLLTGGIPAALVAAVFLLWLGGTGWRAWRERAREGRRRRYSMLAIILLLAASIVDYPLRTPLLTTIFALLCGLVTGGRPGSEGVGEPADEAVPR